MQSLPLSAFVLQLERGDSLVLSWCSRQVGLFVALTIRPLTLFQDPLLPFASQLLVEWSLSTSFVSKDATELILTLLRAAPHLAAALTELLAHSNANVREAISALLVCALSTHTADREVPRALLESGLWAAIHRQQLRFPTLSTRYRCFLRRVVTNNMEQYR
jgi:hypothetical protein